MTIPTWYVGWPREQQVQENKDYMIIPVMKISSTDVFYSSLDIQDFIWDSVGAKSRVYALLLDYLKARTPKRAISISGG
jgi:hypothetical protein